MIIYVNEANPSHISSTFHQVMNRGYDGKNIFPEDEDKNHFLELLELAS